MRSQDSLCREISVFCRTNPFKEVPQFFLFESEKLVNPTANTIKLIDHALRLIDRGYRDGYEYKKAGIRLSDFYHSSEYQLDFFYPHDTLADQKLMENLDK